MTMKVTLLVYAGYITFFALLVGSVFFVPYLAFKQDMQAYYTAFSYTCHQKLSRSLCLFSGTTGYWIADCLPHGGYVSDPVDRKEINVEDATGAIGYKLPVCARDLGLYCAMLIGGLFYPFVKKLDEHLMYPGIFLILAMVPIGLDGGIQLISEFGLLPFVYESTNLLRLITGAIAGFVAAFYAIDILLNMFDK